MNKDKLSKQYELKLIELAEQQKLAEEKRCYEILEKKWQQIASALDMSLTLKEFDANPSNAINQIKEHAKMAKDYEILNNKYVALQQSYEYLENQINACNINIEE